MGKFAVRLAALILIFTACKDYNVSLEEYIEDATGMVVGYDWTIDDSLYD